MLLSNFSNDLIEAGCDEAGRGPLAGPVVASAVIFSNEYKNELLDDSKKLSLSKRNILEEQIKRDAITWAVAEVEPSEIDEINILNASFVAMHRAIEKLAKLPELLLIDGNRFKPYKNLPFECIVKGDGKYLSIAAASILAKNHRDRLMEQAALKFPGYGWERNAGYPTKEHREAIQRLGITPLHRKSFRLLPEQLDLFQ